MNFLVSSRCRGVPRSLRVTVPLTQAHLPGFLRWSRGPRARAAGGSLHTGAILKTLSAGGVSGSLPIGGHASSYGRVALRLFLLCSSPQTGVISENPKSTIHDSLRSLPPPSRKVSERDGSHTGQVVLYWVLVEQAGHEHMSDEYKRPIYYYSTLVFPILGTKCTRDHHSVPSKLAKGGEFKMTNTDLPTCIVDRLLKLS